MVSGLPHRGLNERSPMNRKLVFFIFILGFVFTLGTHGFSQERGTSEAINELKQEIQKLRDQMEAEKRGLRSRLQKMQEKIDAVSRQLSGEACDRGRGGPGV